MVHNMYKGTLKRSKILNIPGNVEGTGLCTGLCTCSGMCAHSQRVETYG